ncbi:mycofactocin biosynthesis glycosyltransferase MftF [Nocardioides alcanivorans]|uniref:mycofactocin biosynthesis glycosyltransferase MftF n=1 Tax=Nocardioides alcanivorans TaxID=2897352 RepID=UPI001EEA7EF5|nr:mycofactocin biosynthesis glycosyltransferase MftF [Nocardioides alcanivorans]
MRTALGLPVGFRVNLAADVRRLEGGRVLLGGSPVGLVKLAERAAASLVTEAHGTHLDVHDAGSAAVADRLLARNLAHPDLSGLPDVSAADVAVVIPVRDRPEQLDRCLAALAPLRCLVVDDGSRDPAPVARVVARHGADLVALPLNGGPAAARNTGLAAVRTPFVALVDSDVVARADDLLALCRHFADPSVALVGPRVIGVVRSGRARWFRRYDTAFSSLDQGPVPAAVTRGATVAWLPSACLLARTEALVDGFDTDLRVGEDVDLVWRLLDAGKRVRYAPEAEVTHDVRDDPLAWLRRIATYGTSGAVLAERHGDTVAPAAFTPLQGITGFAVLARSWTAIPLLATASVVTFRRIRPSLPAGRVGHREAARLTALGLTSATTQATALTLRHWWPLAALGLLTRTGRRTVATALVIDAASALREGRKPTTYPERLAGRRLTDLAYGSGLWWGVLRARSRAALGCLVPRFPQH